MIAARYRKPVVVGCAVLVLAGVAVAVADPFDGASGAGSSSDSAAASALASVQQRALSSQDEVSGTLGYAGSYDVTVPVGTPGATLAQDEAAVQQAQARVAADQRALASAQAQASTQGGAQLAAAHVQLADANEALAAAQRQLAADRRLGCPPASVASPSASAPADRPALPTAGSQPAGRDTGAAAPGATTRSAPSTGTSSATLAGVVDARGSGTAQSSCAAQQQVVAADTAAVAAARDSLAAASSGGGEAVVQAQQALAADQASAAAAEQALGQARQHASTASSSTSPAQTVTALPDAGAILHRGQRVYGVDGAPVPLLYGSTIPWRALSTGVPDGPDVTQLERNLVTLGFGGGLQPDPHFDSDTAAAVRRWQESLGVAQTGVVELGAIVVEPGPIRITGVSAALGQPVQPGTTILSASSTARQVVVQLDATQQSEVNAGDGVSITLPDNSTTPGVVSSVGTVASAAPGSTPNAASGGGSSSSSGSTQPPTIPVYITPSRPQDTGRLDQAPVTVAITTATVRAALVVPVTALLALAGGGYALEVVPATGPHQLVAVRLGLFDDADGLVQVSGSGVRAGQRIVVPAKP